MKTSKPDIEIGDDIVEGANLALSNNLAVIVAVLGLVIVVLAGLLFSVKGKLNALQAKYDFYIREDLMENLHYTKKVDGYMDRLDKYIDEYDRYGIYINAIGDITVFGGKSKREKLIIIFQKICGRYTIHIFHRKRKTKDANILIEWSARD